MGRPEFVDFNLAFLDLSDFVDRAIFFDQIPGVTKGFGLNVFGNAFRATYGNDSSHADVVSQEGVEIAKVVDVRVSDKHSA